MAKKRYQGAYLAKTDIGRVRVTNEDQARALVNANGDVLLAVFDGMGGANKGDFASKVGIDHLVESFNKRKSGFLFPYAAVTWLTTVLREANEIIYQQSWHNESYKGMGTTAVVALIMKDKLVLLNIGDSRAYSYDHVKGLKLLSQDQSYAEYLVKTGKIDQEDASRHPSRHTLMNALGIYPSLSLDSTVLPYGGESILLCSDGLYNNMSEQELESVLASDDRADIKVTSLIGEANANGGSDNIAIAYWEAIHD